ncbi:cation diffusion facilitator family transporter [Tessaracoccus antarcticus]|uniref:Cation transporter n=1 Tax=Tessaracoccus antarcticus TaxID=2479848 RepID=A0A3M0GYA3_9ACTN|nr:cation diffusion facilitator family transporter [Tessaracoccus antarcticus]RMB62286.1 cation transporter [Tessaracoccus antarcticus]
MSVEGGNKAVIAAATANGFIAITKFGAWLLTGSSSMLAEGIHSIADTGNQALLLIGGRNASKAADPEHPFGYGRSRYLAGFLVSVVLFSLGGLFALYEAWHKFQDLSDPSHAAGSILDSQWWWVPIVVLVFAMGAEGMSLRTALKEVGKIKGTQGWFSFVRTSKAPELPVIMLEDVAALLGLTFALAGVGLTLITGQLLFDVLGTAMIGVLLVVVAIILAIETRSLLLGESASPEDRQKIREALEATDGVERVIHFRTLHLGPEQILLAAKVGVDVADSAAEVADLINRAEAAVRTAVPHVTVSYIEPDIYDPHHTPRQPPAQETP